MRDGLRRRVGEAGWYLAVALVGLACAVPVNADTLKASHGVTTRDQLFDTAPALSASEPAFFSPDLVVGPEESKDGLPLAAVPFEAETLDLLANRDDSRSESGTEGVRRFIVLAIVFGAALRYLTSTAFYDWAADVFDPLDGY